MGELLKLCLERNLECRVIPCKVQDSLTIAFLDRYTKRIFNVPIAKDDTDGEVFNKVYHYLKENHIVEEEAYGY